MLTESPTANALAFDVRATDTESGASAVCWGAIIAGGVAAAAISLILLAFGLGMGFAVTSPWTATASSTSFHIGAGLYFIVTAMIASGVGGYLAGRLRLHWQGVHSREVFFRDTAHGFLAWGVATLLSAIALGSVGSSLANGALVNMTRVTGQAAATPLDDAVDSLVRAEPAAGTAVGEPAPMRAEVTRIFSASIRRGELDSVDRAYLVRVVSARTGLSEARADERVSAAFTQARLDVDKARHAAAQLSLWWTAALLIGAFAASLAALEGGGLRDGTWGYKV